MYFKSRVFVCQRERWKWEIERGPYGCEHRFVPAGPEAMLKLGLLSFTASLVVIVHLTFRFPAPYFCFIHFTALCGRLSFFCTHLTHMVSKDSLLFILEAEALAHLRDLCNVLKRFGLNQGCAWLCADKNVFGLIKPTAISFSVSGQG